MEKEIAIVLIVMYTLTLIQFVILESNIKKLGEEVEELKEAKKAMEGKEKL